jgi:hypothetical protein
MEVVKDLRLKNKYFPQIYHKLTASTLTISATVFLDSFCLNPLLFASCTDTVKLLEA